MCRTLFYHILFEEIGLGPCSQEKFPYESRQRDNTLAKVRLKGQCSMQPKAKQETVNSL